MSPETILVLSNITRAYRAGIPGCGSSIDALRGVSLDVHAAEFVGIEGPPSSGKTTLLLCAAGLLRPDSGTVHWPACASRTTQAPNEVRYVGDRATTFGFLTVRESLAYATTLREIDEPRRRPLEHDPLDIAGLRELTGTRVALLSRAERARFLVALALITAPKLLLVDDLTADCNAVAYSDLAGCLTRVARSGPAVLWTARTLGGVTPGDRGYELVRGRLRERSGSVRPADPVSRAPDAHGVRSRPHSTQRVAEP